MSVILDFFNAYMYLHVYEHICIFLKNILLPAFNVSTFKYTVSFDSYNSNNSS